MTEACLDISIDPDLVMDPDFVGPTETETEEPAADSPALTLPADWWESEHFAQTPELDELYRTVLAGANCFRQDPYTFVFYPDVEDSEAKSICAECEVVSKCLRYALEVGDWHGVWGGYNENDRRLIFKLWKAAKADGEEWDDFYTTLEDRMAAAKTKTSPKVEVQPRGGALKEEARALVQKLGECEEAPTDEQTVRALTALYALYRSVFKNRRGGDASHDEQSFRDGLERFFFGTEAISEIDRGSLANFIKAVPSRRKPQLERLREAVDGADVVFQEIIRGIISPNELEVSHD
jgi:hypothetical protein